MYGVSYHLVLYIPKMNSQSLLIAVVKVRHYEFFGGRVQGKYNLLGFERALSGIDNISRPVGGRGLLRATTNGSVCNACCGR